MTDQQALRQYAVRRDAEAFRLLVEQYQRLVYSAASRRLAHQQDIEDVVQTTFLKLARAAGTIRRDLAAWLYRTAINAANELIRRDATRRRHEALAAANTAAKDLVEGAEWQNISLIVDEVMLELPLGEQSLLVEHFLRGRSQRELAKELRVSQSTITRRIRDAVEALRERLVRRGVTAGSPLISETLGSLAQATVPSSLSGELAKIGLAGAGPAAPSAGFGGLGITGVGVGLGAKIGLAAAGLAVLIAGIVLLSTRVHAPASAMPPIEVAEATPAPQAVAASPPATSTAPAGITAQDVIALSKATQARFQSIETHFTINAFNYSPTGVDKVPIETDNITYRKSPDGLLCEWTFSFVSRNDLHHESWKVSVGPTSAKTLKTANDAHNVERNVGRVMKNGNITDPRIAEEVLQYMWERADWQAISKYGAKLTQDAAKGQITLISGANPVDGSFSMISLDPAKGYEPTTGERRTADGKIIEKTTFTDFREVEKGLWLPFQWTKDYPSLHSIKNFAIQSARVNVPFKPNELDIEFPANAGITDENGKLLSREPGPGEVSDGNGVIHNRSEFPQVFK